MTEPRQILPGKTYKVSRQVAHKQKLFDPRSDEIKRIFRYCLAYAAQITKVELHAFSVLPDRYFAVLTDPQARLPEFMRLLNRNVAKIINAGRPENESVFTGKYDPEVLEEEPEIRRAMIETLLSPVTYGFAKNLGEWTGLWSRPQLIGRKVKAKRPSLYFRKDGKMPAELELEVKPPPFSAGRRLKKFRRQLAAKLKPRQDSSPVSESERATDRQIQSRKIAWRKAYRQFCAAYHRALRFWRRLMRSRRRGRDVTGARAVFPQGTYWMERFCCVECEV